MRKRRSLDFFYGVVKKKLQVVWTYDMNFTNIVYAHTDENLVNEYKVLFCQLEKGPSHLC